MRGSRYAAANSGRTHCAHARRAFLKGNSHTALERVRRLRILLYAPQRRNHQGKTTVSPRQIIHVITYVPFGLCILFFLQSGT